MENGLSTEIKYYAVLRSVGVRKVLRDAVFNDLFGHLFGIVNEKGVSPLQVGLIKREIKAVLDSHGTEEEILDYKGRGGHRFIKCHGVKIHLMPFAMCGIK